MFRKILIRTLISVSALLVFVAASCADQSQKKNADTAPPWNVSFRWSGESGVDLDSPDMQMVRATVESNVIAEFLNTHYGYPGWSDLGTQINQLLWIKHPMREAVGTAHLHVLMNRTPSPNRIIVCKDMSGTSWKQDNRYPFPDPNNPSQSLEAISVGVGGPSPLAGREPNPVNTPSGPVIPGPNGRTARPTTNVFSGFAITDFEGETGNYLQFCLPWAQARWGGPQPPKPNRTEEQPPKVEPFSPGWKKTDQ